MEEDVAVDLTEVWPVVADREVRADGTVGGRHRVVLRPAEVGRHVRTLPVAVLLGALLLGLADVLGRTVIAPAQLPAGLVVALLGAPYFVYLLAGSRP